MRISDWSSDVCSSDLMRPFHMILQDVAGTELRRIDFYAEGTDHAFQIARNESDGVHVELWQGTTLLARRTKSGANIWTLLPTTSRIIGTEERMADRRVHEGVRMGSAPVSQPASNKRRQNHRLHDRRAL